MKSDKFLRELKVKGKVTYDEYVAYLKGKSDEEIAGLYIELQLKLEWSKKITPWFYFGSCFIMAAGVIADYKNRGININDYWEIFNTEGVALLLLSFVVLMFCTGVLVHSDINLKRKILIIEDYQRRNKKLSEIS